MWLGGVPPRIIERVLDHTSGTLGGVAGTYNRFQYLEEMRDPLARWASHVEAVVAVATCREQSLSCEAGRAGPGHDRAASQLSYPAILRNQ